MIEVRRADPGCPDAVALQDELSDYLERLTGSSGRASFDPVTMMDPRAAFAIAFAAGRAIGCGALRPIGTGVAEIKRMYVRPSHPGAGGTILHWLEQEAVRLGYTEIWLETRRVNERAVRFYRRHLYREIEPFGAYRDRPEAICMGKVLVPDIV